MALTDKKAAKEIVCDSCDSGDLAETRCKECGIFLCQYCTGFHRRSRATKRHEVVSMEELKSSAGPESIAEKIRCPKHKEEVIKLFCKTCQVTICRDCTIVDHRQHEYGFVEDVALQEKQKLQKNLDEVKQRKVRVVQGISNLKKFDEGLIAKEKAMVSEINKHFDELAIVMASRKRKLVEKTTSLTSLKQKKIHAQLEQLEMALASCESSIEFTEQAFKNGNDVQILSMEKCILQSLENLKKVKDQTHPCVSEHMVFSIPSSVKKTEQTLFNAYAIDDVVASPGNCTASFDRPETHLELGKQSSITVICKDKNKKRLRYGGQLIKPMFSGMEVSNVTVTDGKDGSYIVNFTPMNQGVMVKFEVTVNGKPAPRCTLTKSVRWVISNAHGSGPITNNGLTMTGEGRNGEYCCRVGGCYFESGVHTWKVRAVLREDNPVYLPFPSLGQFQVQNLQENQVNVGVIDYNEIDIADRQMTGVCAVTVNGNGTDISLTLDMSNKTLNVSWQDDEQQFFDNYYRTGGNATNYQLKFNASRVSPFFASSSADVSLTII